MAPRDIQYRPILSAIGPLSLQIDIAYAEPPPGDYTFGFKHDGRERSYIVHVPRDTLTNPWPVVLNFHGGGSSAAGQQAYSRMDETSDREGFLAVYPSGTGIFGNRLLTWNAGACCGYALNNKVDDVGFVQALIDDLEKHAAIDRARIYATGLSNGAMMAYWIAAKAPELLAAIAPVAGAQIEVPFRPKAAIPILHIHSTATRVTYGPCKDGIEVVLWKLTGAGHVWPGGASDYLDRMLGSQSKILGPPTDVINANTQIWQFLSRYHTNFLK